MTQQSPWEIAAASVEYPVITVAEGVIDRPRLSQWGGGEPDAPASVTLSYDSDDLQITTYSEVMWGEREPWSDIWDLVESSFGSWWEGTEMPLEYERLTVAEATKTPTEKGHSIFTTYESLPADQEKDRRLQRREAVTGAKHRETQLVLGDSSVQAAVVGESNYWVTGFETTSSDAPVVGLLCGTDASPDSLRLGLVTNLLEYLSRGPRPGAG